MKLFKKIPSFILGLIKHNKYDADSCAETLYLKPASKDPVTAPTATLISISGLWVLKWQLESLMKINLKYKNKLGNEQNPQCADIYFTYYIFSVWLPFKQSQY